MSRQIAISPRRVAAMMVCIRCPFQLDLVEEEKNRVDPTGDRSGDGTRGGKRDLGREGLWFWVEEFRKKRHGLMAGLKTLTSRALRKELRRERSVNLTKT